MSYRVLQGDSLSAIAAIHGLEVDDILAANPHKARLELPSGAQVFESLALGEDIVVPGYAEGRPAGVLGEPGMIGAVNPNVITTGALCGGGSSAATVQQALNELGYGPLKVDRIISQGGATMAAIKKFSANFGVGPNVTWPTPAFCNALKAALTAQQAPPPIATPPVSSPPVGTSPPSTDLISPCLASGGTWDGAKCVSTRPAEDTPPATTNALATSGPSTPMVAVAVAGAVGLAGIAIFMITRAASSPTSAPRSTTSRGRAFSR